MHECIFTNLLSIRCFLTDIYELIQLSGLLIASKRISTNCKWRPLSFVVANTHFLVHIYIYIYGVGGRAVWLVRRRLFTAAWILGKDYSPNISETFSFLIRDTQTYTSNWLWKPKGKHIHMAAQRQLPHLPSFGRWNFEFLVSAIRRVFFGISCHAPLEFALNCVHIERTNSQNSSDTARNSELKFQWEKSSFIASFP